MGKRDTEHEARARRVDALAAWLSALEGDSAHESRLIARLEERWLLVALARGANEVRVDAPGRKDPWIGAALHEDGLVRLRTKGWQRVAGGRRWSRMLPCGARRWAEIGEAILDTWEGLFGALPQVGFELTIEHDEREHPTNPELAGAITRVVELRDEPRRRDVYHALINATLLVPTSTGDAVDAEVGASTADDHQAERSPPLHLWRDEDGTPVPAVFTDWEALRCAFPCGIAYAPRWGAELVCTLAPHDGDAAAWPRLLINPLGDLGGALFDHELAMLARGVRAWRRAQVN